MYHIYAIINKINNKFYVGRSQDVNNRIKTHFYLLNKNMHFNKNLQKDWNLYGELNFESTILHEIYSLNDAIFAEQAYLDEFINKDILYNISDLAITGVNRNINHHNYNKTPKEWMGEETYKQSLIKKSQSIRGEKNHFYGKHHSDETKKLLAQKCALYGEKNGFFGKHHSEETKQKIRDTKKRKLDNGEIKTTGKPVSINNIEYRSIAQACRDSGLEPKYIKKVLYNGGNDIIKFI